MLDYLGYARHFLILRTIIHKFLRMPLRATLYNRCSILCVEWIIWLKCKLILIIAFN